MKQKFYNLEKLDNITSVIKDFIFFAEEKWKTLAIRAGVVIRLILAAFNILMIFCKGMACLKILANNFLMNIESIKAC